MSREFVNSRLTIRVAVNKALAKHSVVLGFRDYLFYLSKLINSNSLEAVRIILNNLADRNFDFKEVVQESESLDFEKLTPCPHCKKPIPADATMCLYCGESVAKRKKPTWVIYTAIFLIVLFFIVYVLLR